MDHAIGRRDFLQGMGGMAATAGVGLFGASATATAESAPPVVSGAQGEWDMSWVKRVRRKHRVVFDSPQVAFGVGPGQVVGWMDGMRAAEGIRDEDMNAVLVLRHEAAWLTLDHSIWRRMGVAPSGRSIAATDTTTKPAGRNPYITEASSTPPVMYGLEGVDKLIERGVIVLACSEALKGLGGLLRNREKIEMGDAVSAVRKAVIPGVYVMPNGIYAVCRAQEAGCQYFRAMNT